MKRNFTLPVVLTLSLALWNCASAMPIYYPVAAEPSVSAADLGTLLVSSKLQVLQINGKTAEKKGREGTVYRLPAGVYAISAKVDYIDAIDAQLINNKYYSSGTMTISATIKPNTLHNLQVNFSQGMAELHIISAQNPFILPDGSRVKFSPESQQVALIRGEKTETFPLVTNSMSVSPDGRRLAFLAFFRGTFVAYYRLMLDGSPGEDIGGLLKSYWSRDSRHFAYVATGLMMYQPLYIVVDSVVSPPYDDIADTALFHFSKEGSFCFAGQREKIWRVICGKNEKQVATRQAAETALAEIKNKQISQ